jgi:hypothetical protein
MKFLASSLFLGLAAAAETVTISHFLYVGVNGYPQLSFNLSVDGVSCAVEHYEVPGTGYACSSPEWTFDVLEAQGHALRLHHAVDGFVSPLAQFNLHANLPIDKCSLVTSKLG